jgi:uncharacterized cofD-like protein
MLWDAPSFRETQLLERLPGGWHVLEPARHNRESMPDSKQVESGASALRIVSIGGGTGLSALLRGLKRYVAGAQRKSTANPADPAVEITAIVTVTDDGGSSGRLRRDLHVPPPGDIRNCLVALSEDEDLLSRLFRHRFDAGEGLKGHSFGNLFLSALCQITGDFPHAVSLCSEVLAIAGRIYPSTAADVSLRARLRDGSEVQGESNISATDSAIARISLEPSVCEPLPETLHAIRTADLITVGPGSLFTSVIPNLLVQGIPEAIAESPARKVYVSNLMWQPGETMHFSASQHVEAIFEHAGRSVFDTIVVNTAEAGEELRAFYREQQAEPVEQDIDKLQAMGLEVVMRDLLGETDRIRHQPDLLAEVLVELAAVNRLATTSQGTRTAQDPVSNALR